VKKKQPLVSVIVASYNHEKYITQCIESIVNQTYSNIELIVIDDCSSDNSQNILISLQKKYNFKLIINNKNMGVSETRNIGIKVSKGKYITGCASDDYLANIKVEKLVSFLESNEDYAMCYGKEASVKNGIIKVRDNPCYKSGNIFDDLFLQKFWIPAGSTLLRKDIFLSVGGYDRKLKIEDYDLWLRIASQYKIGYVNEVMYFYRIHNTNTSNNIMLMESEIKKIFYKWRELPLYSEALKKNEFLFFYYYSENNKVKSIQKLPTAISYWKNRLFWIAIAKILLPFKIIKILKSVFK
jgi:alpha-1,3-rhamnosyltransferase